MLDKREAVGGMAALVVTVRAGSFSAAAAQLGMTPSAVSKLVAQLEARLGVQLLVRTTRRMELTEAGSEYFERAQRVLDEIDGLEREVEGLGQEPRGRLAVTAPTVLGQKLIAPIVFPFQCAHPAVSVALELTDRVVDIVAERFDVAIRMTDRPPESFVARKLADDHRVLCASPTYLERHGRPERPEDLDQHQCLAFVSPNARAVWYLRKEPGGDVEARPVGGRLTVNHTYVLHQAALEGFGIADLPRYLASDDLAAGRLISLLEPFVPTRRSVYAIYLASRRLPAKTRVFLEYLEAALRPQP